MQERKLRGQVMVLRVGCLCVSGHHRSVAFAELLAKVEWPTSWRVEVQHRNLTDAVKDKKERLRQEAKEAKNEIGTDWIQTSRTKTGLDSRQVDTADDRKEI